MQEATSQDVYKNQINKEKSILMYRKFKPYGMYK